MVYIYGSFCKEHPEIKVPNKLVEYHQLNELTLFGYIGAIVGAK